MDILLLVSCKNLDWTHGLGFSRLRAFRWLRPPPSTIPKNNFLLSVANKGLRGDSDPNGIQRTLWCYITSHPPGGHTASTAWLLTQIIEVLPESLHPLVKLVPAVSSKKLRHSLSRHAVDNREVTSSSLGVLIHSSNSGFLGTTNCGNELPLQLCTGVALWPVTI